MKTITRMELKRDMIIAEDILDFKNNVIVTAGTKVTDPIIEKLKRNSIIAVSVKEEIDFATTHNEKVTLSDGFKKFEANYNKFFPIYKTYMMNYVLKDAPISVENLMKVYQNIMVGVPNGETLLDYLYNMKPSVDDLTHAHCLNSALIAGVFGTWLGLSDEDINVLIKCAYFYDIGKLWIPNEILWKQGKLTAEEYDLVKKHARRGYDALRKLPWNGHIAMTALQHHERMDGSGYPQGLYLKDIDRFARIIMIVDTYDAMTSYRPWRPVLNPFQVILNYEKTGMMKYDLEYLSPILVHIANTQLGMTVQLSNGQKAEVILINENSLAHPLVKILDSEQLIDLALYKDITIDAVY